MTPIFKKLNFKNQSAIVSVNHPDSFQDEIDKMLEIVPVVTDISAIENIEFAISFVTQENEIEEIAKSCASKWSDDPVLWFCYPKRSSKKYKCDFNRDSGWQSLGKYGLEPVRQVAIDEDWSALRFRKVENIKSITRNEKMVLTEEARKRITENKK